MRDLKPPSTVRARLSILKQKPKLAIKWILLSPFYILRILQLEIFLRRFKKLDSKELNLFSFDLHISVIREIKTGLKSFPNVNVVSWSISSHNFVIRRFFKFADPVKYINARNWNTLSQEQIQKFLKRYQRYLKQFDGFIISYPPAFIQIFSALDKPIFLLIPTRYEIPYTNNPPGWEKLNHVIIDVNNTGKLILCANSVGDADYFEFHTGLRIEVMPTVGDYIQYNVKKQSTNNVFFTRSKNLEVLIPFKTKGLWRSAHEVLGSNFKSADLFSCQSVLIIPYNSNTMQMFELSAIGMPVVVPSRKFLISLIKEHPNEGIMSEMSLAEVYNLPINHLRDDDPNNYSSKVFLEYWLDRCDFYNKDLMPNIIEIDSFEELLSLNEKLPKFNFDSETAQRNSILGSIRKQKLQSFIEICKKYK
jgi:hypothetical protein